MTWRCCIMLWSAWMVEVSGFCSSIRGVVMTDGGSAVAGANVSWQNRGVCAPSPPQGTMKCRPPTVTGYTKSANDGNFVIPNLPADTYLVCVYPPAGSLLLSSCAFNPVTVIELGEGEDRAGVRMELRSGSRVVIAVSDPAGAVSTTLFRTGVAIKEGSYYAATYDEKHGGTQS